MEQDKTPQLKFSRVEYKYLISQNLAEELKKYFSKHADLDLPNDGGKPYAIHSIYFDSPGLIFGQEKIDGHNERIKVRLRTYPDHKDENFFLEMKKKKGDRIYKERIQLSADDYRRIMKGEINFFLEKNELFFEKMWYLFHHYRLSPKVMNKYRRVSFIDRFVNCKISFDSEFFSSSPECIHRKNLLLKPLENRVIMELKFDRYLPDYFLGAVKRHNLSRISSSKYLLSLQKSRSNYLIATRN